MHYYYNYYYYYDVTPQSKQDVSAQRYVRAPCFGLGVTSQVTSSIDDVLIWIIVMMEINGDLNENRMSAHTAWQKTSTKVEVASKDCLR